MAASIASRRGATSSSSIFGPMLAATAMGSALYAVNSRSLRMEGSSQAASSKPSIYSSAPEPVYLAEVRGPLEEQVAGARRAVSDATKGARDVVQGQVSRWIGVEKSVERKVSDLIPNDESLTPGILYVGIATLAGSVFTRYRSLPLRLVTPPILLVTSLNYFLPKTAHNLSQYYIEVEQKHLPPSVRTQREALIARWRETRHTAGEQLSKARQGTGDLVQRGLQGVEENTGLKVGGTQAGEAPKDQPKHRLV